MNMRADLPADLVRFAANLSDPQHATLAAVLREAADALQATETSLDQRDVDSSRRVVDTGNLVFDSDGVPMVGRVCFNCEP
jgi:DNA-binding MurR/RpiR family transcriptional regulator